MSAFKGIELHMQTLKWIMILLCVYGRGLVKLLWWLCVSLCGKKHTALSIFSKQKGRPNLKDTSASAFHEPCASAVKTLGWTLTLPSVLLNDSHPLTDRSNPTILQLLLSGHTEIKQTIHISKMFWMCMCFWKELLPAYCTALFI